MSAMDLWIARAIRRLNFGQFLQSAAEWLATFFFLYGGTVLLSKLVFPSLWPHILWMGFGAVPVAAAAWWLTRGRRFSRGESVALLERRLQTGGLLLTLSERPDAEWADRLPQVQQAWADSLPRVRPVRFARLLFLPILFAIGACLVPLRQLPAEPILQNTASKTATNQLEETLAALEEAKVLEPEEKQKLQEEIEKLAEETREQPLTHEKWETVDALRERMKLRLESAELNASKAAQAVSTLRQAMEKAGLNLNPEKQAELENEVIETLRKLQKRGAQPGKMGSGGDRQKEALQRLMKNGRLSDDPQERQEELESLDDFLKSECEKLGKCRGKRQGSGDDGSEVPGRGGVTRGRADAELTYGEESTEEGTKFKEVVLPPGYLDKPGDEIVEITPTAPDETAAANAPRGAQRAIDAASGNESVSRQVRPRHKQVIRKYFDSPKTQ